MPANRTRVDRRCPTLNLQRASYERAPLTGTLIRRTWRYGCWQFLASYGYKTGESAMKNSDRFRSTSRAAAFLVGLGPLVWLHVEGPGPIWTSITDFLMTLAIFGPAAASAFGMAYLVYDRRVAWLCSAAAVGSFLGLLAAFNASQESSTAALAFMMVTPAYIGIFLVGYLGEAAARHRRASRVAADR